MGPAVNEPSFILIGAGKAGTSFVFEMLRHHQEIFWSTPKEVNFFSFDRNYEKGWEWYCQHFEGADEAKAIGEGSPSYSSIFEQTPQRMARHIPNAKLIYTVRDPIERIRSHYMQFLQQPPTHGTWVPNDINEAVKTVPHLVGASRYWHWLQAYGRHFSQDQSLVIFAEDMRADPDAVLNCCFKFLGVDPNQFSADTARRVNPWQNLKRDRFILKLLRQWSGLKTLLGATPGPLKTWFEPLLQTYQKRRPELTEETRQWLAETLREDAYQLLDFCGKSRGFWNL